MRCRIWRARSLWLVTAAALLVTTGGCSKQARKERFLHKADRHFQAGQYEKAEIEYLNVLQFPPPAPHALARLGQIYYEQGRTVRAYKALQRATELDPENMEARAKLALIYSFLRQGKDAEEQAGKVLEQQPANEDALLVLSNAGLTTNEIGRIRQKIEALQKANPDAASFHLALGTIYLRQGDVAGAEAAFHQALTMAPRSSAAHAALANLYLARNEIAKAGQELSTAAELAPIRSTRRLKLAEFKLQTGAAPEAKKLLEDITARAPDYLPAWSYLAQISLAERHYDEAARLVKKVLAKEPADYEGLMLESNLKLARGQFAEALVELSRMTTLYPRSAQLHYRLGFAHKLSGDIPKAESELSQALILEPGYAEAVLLLSEIRIVKGDAAQAATPLLQLVKAQPQIVQAHLLLGAAYTAQQNFDQALGVYRGMEKLFPRNPEAAWLAGMMLLRLNQPEEARREWEHSLELRPEYLPPLEQLVNLELNQKAYATALGRVQHEIEKRPKLAELRLLLAKVYLAQEKLAEGQAALLEAIELDPDQSTGYLLLSEVYLRLNQPQQAIEKLEAGLARKPDPAVLMQIGLIEQKRNHFSAACDAYERVLALDSKFGPALNNAAFLYADKLNNLDKAWEYADRARQLFPKDPAVLDTAGWVLFKKGDYAGALPLFRESAQKLGRNPEPQFHFGLTCYMLGQEAAAREALDRTLQLGGDFYGKEEATRRLAILDIDPRTADAATVTRLEQCLQEAPGDLVAAGRLASIYDRKGALQKAIEVSEAALGPSPKNGPLLARLSRYYARGNNPDKALEYAKRAHDAAPENAEVCRDLARLVYRSGDYKWALSLFEEAARRMPKNPDLDYDLAWAYYALGRLEPAAASMQKALAAATHETEAKPFLDLIDAYRHPERLEAAEPLARQILATNAAYTPALLISAALHVRSGKAQEARPIYEKILSQNPAFAVAARDLAVLYPEVSLDDSKAYELAVQAREAFPDDPKVARTLGILACKRGEFSRSVQLLKESALTLQGDAHLFFYLGMAQAQAKAVADAKANLQQALDLNLPPALAEEAKRLLAKLK